VLTSRFALVVVLLAWARAVPAQAPGSARPSPEPSPAPRRSIAESVEPAVERYLREHAGPCTRAEAERIPCFPVTVEEHGPVYSVADSIRSWKPDASAAVAATAPTSPYGTPVAGFGFDPVCTGKSLLKGLRGKNDTYYLYRVWDQAGERAVLRDEPLEPGRQPTLALLGYELLGKIDGECEAIGAWRKANREAEERNRSRSPVK
jgi:hypothetical protein